MRHGGRHTRGRRVRFTAVSHDITYCTNASRGLSAIVKLLFIVIVLLLLLLSQSFIGRSTEGESKGSPGAEQKHADDDGYRPQGNSGQPVLRFMALSAANMSTKSSPL